MADREFPELDEVIAGVIAAWPVCQACPEHTRHVDEDGAPLCTECRDEREAFDA